MASLWKLPLLLVCENNQFAEFMRTQAVTAGRICDRARAYGIPAVPVDGNDVLAVWEAAAAAVERARAGAGASLIEAQTYRLRGHVEAEAGFLPWKYRTDEEIASWAARDPIDSFVARLRANGQLSQEEYDGIEKAVAQLVSEAAAFAEASELPNTSMLADALFAPVSGPGA